MNETTKQVVSSMGRRAARRVTGDGRRTVEALLLDDPRACAMHNAYLEELGATADEVPGAATLDELVFYAADAKAPPHAGKRGKAEREAETGFAGTLLGGGAPAPSREEEESSQEV